MLSQNVTIQNPDLSSAQISEIRGVNDFELTWLYTSNPKVLMDEKLKMHQYEQ